MHITCIVCTPDLRACKVLNKILSLIYLRYIIGDHAVMINLKYFCRAERENYYKHGCKARYAPDKYLSLIIDGMDQSKHNLPHFQVTTKVFKQ